jgi:hypothetical protein
MKGVSMQIQVLKANGSQEPYLHTKVLGTLHKAMALSDPESLEKAQSIADAITYYLYHHGGPHEISTEQIHQLILRALDSTGHEVTAELMDQHRLHRSLQRNRIEVIDGDMIGWNKVFIVSWLIDNYGIDHLMARAIAGTVEEQVMQLGLTRIRKSLVRHLTVTNAEQLLEADRQLTEMPLESAVL